MRVVFSNAARGDLGAIYQHGVSNFGLKVAKAYLEKLRNSVSLIGKYPMLAHESDSLPASFRLHAIGAHVIIYQLADIEVRVIRILRSEQNWVEHL